MYRGGSLKCGNVKSCGCATASYMKEAQRRRNPSGRRTDNDGYVWIRVEAPLNDKISVTWKQEHRCVMEEKLGRPLRDDEEVHHKNGIRCDNNADNLELWLKSKQPKGARLEDLIEHSVKLLREHRPELLNSSVV